MPTAAHLHVLLNHIPLIGTFAGAIALGIALLLRSRAACIPALVVIAICAASAFAVNSTGQNAYKDIRGITDDAGTDWLDQHMERAERYAPVFYGLASLAVIALLAPRKWPKSAFPLAGLTLIAALGTGGLAGWIAQAGGQVRHPEFREGAPPAKPDSEQPHIH